MRKNLLWIPFIALLILSVLSRLSVNMIEVNALETHDIAVTSVWPSSALVKLGEFVNITVVVENQGTENETFDVTAYYDNTAIGGAQTVTDLPPGNKTTLTFSWDTNTTDIREEIYASTLKEKTYDINATAPLASDVNPDDNTLVSPSTVKVVAYYITVVPQSTWNQTLEPGMTYTVSIYTDYNGSDVYSYLFTLSYNPDVLHIGINTTRTWTGDGSTKNFVTFQKILPYTEKVYVNGTLQTRDEDYTMHYELGWVEFFTAPGVGADVKLMYPYDGVVNGDLITTDKDPSAKFTAGTFNNTLGKLEPTVALFVPEVPPAPTTSGPGILANVTFTVVGEGFSDITLGDETYLRGSDGVVSYPIIKDAKTMPGHIQHGFFCNIQPRHDVAVSLVAPDTAAVEQPVPINVNVLNNGTYNENVNLTVYYDTTVINSTTFLLKKGLSNIVPISWDTSGLANETYTINATATVLESIENPTGIDEETADNTDTKSVTLQLVHDVAVVSLVVPDTAAVEQPVPISLNVTNEGSYDEDVSLKVYNETTVIDSTTFTLAKGPTSHTFSCSWNTSGVALGTYKIHANATIIGYDDDYPDNNNKTKAIALELRHDVAVVSLDFTSPGTVGHLVPISVTVANEGSHDEDVTLTVYYENATHKMAINSTSFTLAKGPTSNASSFSWNTSGLAEDLYKINATATIDQDDDLSDNNKTGRIMLREIHDVKVVSIEVPLRGNVDNSVSINVTVENTGSFYETFNVTTYYDGNAIEKKTNIALTAGANTSLTFTWNTIGVAPGFYTITAAAGLSKTDTWTGDGVTEIFNTTLTPVVRRSEEVYVNQTLMTKPANYTIDYSEGEITFTTAPGVGAQIKATYLSGVANETYTADNSKTFDGVLVTILGDVDGDGAVGTSDLSDLNEAYGSEYSKPNWDPYCDLNGDDKVDASDLFVLSKNFGKSVP